LHVHSEASHLLLHLHELVLHHVLRGIELILLLVLVVLHRLLGLLLLQQHLHVESARVHEHVLATEGTHAARLHHHLAADVVAAELTVRRTTVHVGHVTTKLARANLPRLLDRLVHVRHAVLALLTVATVVVVSLGATLTTSATSVGAKFTRAVRI
jgi:hypothetical protein